MRGFLRAAAIMIAVGAVFATPTFAAENAKLHRVAIHVDQNDADVMKMALNNAGHVIEYYRGRGEQAEVEIVAYGPGLHMLRADTSPVQDRIRAMKEEKLPVGFSACNNTMEGMEKREGHPISIVPQAQIVPSGVVRLMELQEQGWSYVRP